MAILAIACKTIIAVLLLAAGGAKLADLPGFAASVRLFAPEAFGRRLVRPAALVVSLGEVALGAASLAAPQAGWLNIVVLAIAGGFVVVACAGYRWHRGRPCRCLGALSRRGFSLAGIGRAALIAACAVAAAIPVRPLLLQVGMIGQIGLLGGGIVVACCAYSASAALARGVGRGSEPGLAR